MLCAYYKQISSDSSSVLHFAPALTTKKTGNSQYILTLFFPTSKNNVQ